MTPFEAAVWRTLTLMYHLLCAAHHPGVAIKAVPSGKSIWMPPPAEDATRPPGPRASPPAPSVVKTPSTRSWRPPGSGTPLRFGWKVTRCLPTRAATAVLTLTQLATPVCGFADGK
jgi:hypothetical protein